MFSFLSGNCYCLKNSDIYGYASYLGHIGLVVFLGTKQNTNTQTSRITMKVKNNILSLTGVSNLFNSIETVIASYTDRINT